MNPQQTSQQSSMYGSAQPGSDAGQLPPIHPPQTFHAPQAPVSVQTQGGQQSAGTFASLPMAGHFPLPSGPAGGDDGLHQASGSLSSLPVQPAIATKPAPTNQDISSQTVPAEEPDTALDEEWVGKAREVIAHTKTDPFLQSQQLGQVKAQYLKLRYNKHIGTGENET